MFVLALDTALAATSVAVLDGDRTLAARSEPMERGHQERLAGLVRDVMVEAGAPFGVLTRIGVTVGPGSFTGLRVGLAFAKGLGVALDIPCVGVGTLEALAASVTARGLVAAVIDARRDQLYFQPFEGGVALAEPQALTAPEAEACFEALPRGAQAITLVGSGARLLTRGRGAVIDDRAFPDPAAVARLTAQAVQPIPRPRPLYLRPPDAKTIAERAVPA